LDGRLLQNSKRMKSLFAPSMDPALEVSSTRFPSGMARSVTLSFWIELNRFSRRFHDRPQAADKEPMFSFSKARRSNLICSSFAGASTRVGATKTRQQL